MKQYIVKISELLNHEGLKSEIHSFDSGSFMIDIWIETEYYCLQLFEGTFGISLVTDDVGFGIIPDISFSKWHDFKTHLEKVINA